MTEKNESNRRRKWAPKARTGCRTCKTRHVKCDEQKPVCRRCVLSGFRCDGYPTVPNKRENGSPPSEETSPESPPSDDRTALSVITSRSDTTAATSLESSPTAITPTILTPSDPYAGIDQQNIRYFIDVTASMVGRSRAGPIFWKKFVPQAAWSYPSVRHAVLASAISCQSLMQPEHDSLRRKSSEMLVLSHTSKAVQSLLSNNVPLDVVLLTSATLGILDLFNGQWDTACTHVTYGARLAKQARRDPVNEPFISFYCGAFASALPLVLKRAQSGEQAPPAEKNSVVRLDEAVRSLKLATAGFEETLPKLLRYQGKERDRILVLFNNAKAETDFILPRWDKLLRAELMRTSPPDDEVRINLHRVESPFSAVVADLNHFLDHGGPFDFAKFEVAMERTMPFYTLAKAGPNLQMRQEAVQLMRIGAEIRGQRTTPHSDSPTVTRTIVEISDDGRS